MSQIGKKPIQINDAIDVKIDKDLIIIKGKLGELSMNFDSSIKIKKKDDLLIVTRYSDEKEYKALHGLYRALVANMVEGVSKGFRKELKLVGVGFTADASHGNFLLLNLGFSHPIYFEKPNGIKFETPNATTIIVSGIDKQLVGQVSAKIRELRKPEPFKGKGVRYSDEIVRRKAGKTVGIV